MTSFDRFERTLPELLEELAAPRLPEYADALFARSANQQRSRLRPRKVLRGERARGCCSP